MKTAQLKHASRSDLVSLVRSQETAKQIREFWQRDSTLPDNQNASNAQPDAKEYASRAESSPRFSFGLSIDITSAFNLSR